MREHPTVVLIVADPQLGGGTTVVDALAREYLNAGWNVEVITDASGPLVSQLRAAGATVHTVAFFSQSDFASAVLGIRRIVSNAQPTLVHTHGSRALWFSVLVPRSVPSMHTVHGYHYLHRAGLQRRIGTIVERLANRRIDMTVFVSRQDESLARTHRLLRPTARSVVILNGVALDQTDEPSPRRHGTVAFVSRFEHQKDPLLAVQVAALLPDRIKLLMIGDGSLRCEVNSAIHDAGLKGRVELTGALPRHEMLRQLQSCDALLLTSRWEGLPLTPMEAMHLGVPVVAPRMAATEELIEHTVDGMLVDGRDPRDFAAAITSATQPKEHDRLAAAGRRSAETKFSWASCWAQHRAVVERLTEVAS